MLKKGLEEAEIEEEGEERPKEGAAVVGESTPSEPKTGEGEEEKHEPEKAVE